MPALRDIEQQIKLEDGQSFVGLYDPTKDVSVKETDNMGTRYTFRLLSSDNRIVTLTGGTRLFDEMIKAVGTSERPLRVKVTAKGKAGNMDRTYIVEKITG